MWICSVKFSASGKVSLRVFNSDTLQVVRTRDLQLEEQLTKENAIRLVNQLIDTHYEVLKCANVFAIQAQSSRVLECVNMLMMAYMIQVNKKCIIVDKTTFKTNKALSTYVKENVTPSHVNAYGVDIRACSNYTKPKFRLVRM